MDFPKAARHSPDPPRSYPFAIQHPYLIHGFIVVLCWLTYLRDPEDVVWRFVKVSSSARILEHLAFGVAAVFLGVAVMLGAWPSGNTGDYGHQKALLPGRNYLHWIADHSSRGSVCSVSTAGIPARKASPGRRDRSQPINTHTTMLISASAAKLLRTPP